MGLREHGLLGILLRWVWRLLFGKPVPKAPKPARCAHRHQYTSQDCHSLADPRCEAGNCTEHCARYCGYIGRAVACVHRPQAVPVTWKAPPPPRGMVN